MNILFLLLIIAIILLLFLNYNKYQSYSNNTKKVSWNNNNVIIPPDNISSVIEYDTNISEYTTSSKITSYLDNLKDSYPNAVNISQPMESSIPTKPPTNDILNFNDVRSFNSLNINTNTRVNDFNKEITHNDNLTIGNLYDNLVDNYRVEWGQIPDGLDGNSLHDNHYNIDILKPEDNGYTSFATY